MKSPRPGADKEAPDQVHHLMPKPSPRKWAKNHGDEIEEVDETEPKKKSYTKEEIDKEKQKRKVNEKILAAINRLVKNPK